MRTVRLTEPEVLPTGSPENPCEHENWFELVPTRSFSTASQQVDGGYGYTVHETSSREVGGYAIFRAGELEPESLDAVLPELDEAQLELLHTSRVAPIQSSQRTARLFFWPGVAVTTLGLGGMIATREDGDGFGIATAVACTGLVAMLVSLVIDPSAPEKTFAGIRATTLLPGEDNIDAARRGVDRHNETVRARCRQGQ